MLTPRPGKDWRPYLEAATRKIDIASYHVSRLDGELTSVDRRVVDVPSVPVQAHFEGTIVSVMAAVDQVAQATKSALQLRFGEQDLVTGAFGSLTQTMLDVQRWFDEPIGRDLRRIRVRIVHYNYNKTPQGRRWIVESAGTGFEGSRELLAYARGAAEYGERLRTLLPSIEAEITNRLNASIVGH